MLMDLKALHDSLDADVRDVPWSSNCAGEIFADDGTEHGLRIGHFQGDSALGRFVVAAHEILRQAQAKTSDLAESLPKLVQDGRDFGVVFTPNQRTE